MFDMSHIHPMIVHFPIALLFVGFLFEFLGLVTKKDSFSTTAFYLLILGTISVIAAYFSGEFAGEGIAEAGALKTAIEIHEEAALLSLWLMVSTAILRIAYVLLKKQNMYLKWAAFTLFLLGTISIVRTCYYGRELVYKHAAGVQFSFGFGADNSTDIINSNDDKDED